MEDDVTRDLAEFSLANAIYAALVEAHACEQSARYAMFQSMTTKDMLLTRFLVAMPWTTRRRTPAT